eukprot:CAMPEP_0119059804 /NCGR_PEP_ID=MMETSP1178-20130426/3845_1 /TAXON_ID=33656 /ORGANISM="unid sp, Strain CCMP2000" /LENGTH=133 /DNA_ID=CAMNT_0007040865 /DNA_START=107 /DNA_END=508 /DNA_ORIENTATION=-
MPPLTTTAVVGLEEPMIMTWFPAVVVGLIAQQYAFKVSGVFVPKDRAPSGVYASDKARLEGFGWLQADQRMPLPRPEELTLGRRSPIGKIEGRQVYLSAHHETLHLTDEGDCEGCVVSADFSKHYGTDVYVCI